jgi:pyruvate/2-oxoglutarate/acetoin dehydrogenase E1 component
MRTIQFRTDLLKRWSEEMRRDETIYLMGGIAEYNGAYKASKGNAC